MIGHSSVITFYHKYLLVPPEPCCFLNKYSFWGQTYKTLLSFFTDRGAEYAKVFVPGKPLCLMSGAHPRGNGYP